MMPAVRCRFYPWWCWHARIDALGFHAALQIGRISGVALWPRGPWPKSPLLFWWSK